MSSPATAERKVWLATLAVVICLTVATRLYKLDQPAHIAWDETHFGKFASHYINGTFFLDVHPPLGKMLIALAGHMSGYDGTFSFEKPSLPYGNTSYYGMRLACAGCGMACTPLAYLTVMEMTGSASAASLAAVLMIGDTGLLTLSQYILLDPVLLLFIMLSVYFMAMTQRLHSQQRHFTPAWWFALLASGSALGCAISVKWVGLFVVLLVGMSTAADLWSLLANRKNDMLVLLRHLLARALCLILLPMLVYILWFAVHFQVLKKSGSGDAFFSSAFQSTLEGNSMTNCTLPPEIAYGSVVTLRNGRIAGGLLHSHAHLYPEGVGARQQQITTYHHRDDNNKWIIRRAVDATVRDDPQPEFVHHGDYIRLEHLSTHRLLHSHHHKAPISKRHYQVTGYGFNGTGDMNDVWQIQLENLLSSTPAAAGASGRGSTAGPFVSPDTTKQRIRVLKSRLLLVHNTSHCALHSSSKPLPKWGWEQKEVSCNSKIRHDVANTWIVEGHENSKLENVTLETLKPSLLEKIYESHVVMAQTNSGFKPKPNEQTSRPWMWPINYQGQVFSAGPGDTLRVYLLGNPVIWWLNTACVPLFISLAFFYGVLRRRGVELDVPLLEECNLYLTATSWLFIGWLLHYVPFFMMARVLYFHHYFPAFLFNAMLSGIILDFVLRHSAEQLSLLYSVQLKPCTIHITFMVAVTAVICTSFALFHPLSYGMTGELSHHPSSQMYGLHWLPSWEF